ncbi:uncharacterized protein EI90DRAFT_3033033 [Cantharellus anzutake]|uniref:uncharacterized protein n=1 Tax=Cantharellus anzutake TaxID=1750568 RepID=UPI0019047E2B|nr:uncharacterized protein EI90DRAFT_3096566 [Cantharellus anzutake]XP_038922141.1 uncharacterized protein EI90DRAFT_3033033 [Cantharellus anzutake]KAF8311528.1 hypothetical protein EI90DRAFT_3096566 [Cantharellus anzutake]KAF8341209.1 hypothetical protein EI90DRAFT_3033033 [Cantharellus anzutake]
MAGTSDVLAGIKALPGVSYPVLVPNEKGLATLLNLLETSPSLTNEIAIFVAASESFSKANINCSIAESLNRLYPVVEAARNKGIRVRGYISTVIVCPYEGPVAPSTVRDISKALIDMGCYEVSLGDTTGRGTPASMTSMLESVLSVIPPEKLANHDTFGLGVANALTALEAGIRTIDSSVAGLGGCPYSPGATGNVATEPLGHRLHPAWHRI